MMSIERSLDALTTQFTRQVARFTSRRSLMARAGVMLAGTTAIPLLPMLRASAAPAKGKAGGESANAADPTAAINDPLACEYWRYCALDGNLSACCGGTHSTCPPGTEISTVTWIGTCHNPLDGRDYVISYNDCCGTTMCMRCSCNESQGDRPVYSPAKANDIMWCLGTKTQSYNSTVARVIATAASPGSSG
jgi:methylamine dehydrogenase light chain